MEYKDFAAYVDGLSSFSTRSALVSRTFIRINRTSYKDLINRAYRVANYLTAQSIKPGDRVMIVATNSPEWLELMLGIELIGAVVVSADSMTSLNTILGFIKQTSPDLIFKDAGAFPELDKEHRTEILSDLAELTRDYSFDKPMVELNKDDPGVIVFTSGTTADPKGVVLSQGNILANISGIQRRIKIDPNWRLLSVLPLSHMYELTGSLAILSGGASIHYLPRVTPSAIGQALKDYQITTILAIPQLLSLLLDNIEQTAADQGKTKSLNLAFKLAARLPFSIRRWLFHPVHHQLGGHLSLVVTGGAPIPLDVASNWEKMGVKMVQGYGLTETAPILTVNGLNERRLDSPGRPLDNTHIRIADSGEIQARGPNVFRGYWHNKTATSEALSSDGWFKTGDIGSLEHGWLFIKGRLKFVIVLASGLKVFPEDIELVAEKSDQIESICIVGLKQAEAESVLAVVSSKKSDEQVSRAIDEINGKLESFQHISSWRRWPEDDFPRTRLLKIDRRKVQDWANANQVQQSAKPMTKPQTDPLIKIIQKSLSDQKASVKDSDRLADIGLDSLRRLSVTALIETDLGISVAENEVKASMSVAELRHLISKGSVSVQRPVRPNWPYNKVVRIFGNSARESAVRLIVGIWVRRKVEGKENLKALKTPAIFIFNHSDDFDGPVIYESVPPVLRKKLAVATADDVLRGHKILALITRFCFAGFNFSRQEPYMPSLEYVGDLIDKGWSIVLSPEGRVSPSGKLQPFKNGIGLLAVNLGVPIVPIKTIGLHGTVPLHSKWPKKHSRVTIKIGQPIMFDAKDNYDEVTARLEEVMRNL